MAPSSFRVGLPPLDREPVPLTVARALQRFIASNGLERGARLPSERELAASLGVSRPALREALTYLSAMDILTVRQGAGIFVSQPQHPALSHLGQLKSKDRLTMLRQATCARRLIDVAIAEAAARSGANGAKALFAYIDEAESEPQATLLRHRLDLGFEALLGDLAGDPYLAALQRQAHRFFQEAWEHCGLIPRAVEERNAQHRAIAAAIMAGDAATAGRLMHDHFAHALIGGGETTENDNGEDNHEGHQPP